MAMIPRSVACDQDSSINQTSKNSGITAHSTGEGEATKRFDFYYSRKKAAGS